MEGWRCLPNNSVAYVWRWANGFLREKALDHAHVCLHTFVGVSMRVLKLYTSRRGSVHLHFVGGKRLGVRVGLLRESRCIPSKPTILSNPALHPILPQNCCGPVMRMCVLDGWHAEAHPGPQCAGREEVVVPRRRCGDGHNAVQFGKHPPDPCCP